MNIKEIRQRHHAAREALYAIYDDTRKCYNVDGATVSCGVDLDTDDGKPYFRVHAKFDDLTEAQLRRIIELRHGYELWAAGTFDNLPVATEKEVTPIKRGF